MAEIDLMQKPRKASDLEWKEYRTLTDQASTIKNDTTINALRVAKLATSGTMGEFLKAEGSKIPGIVIKFHKNPEEISVHLAQMNKEKVPGTKLEVEIYSIRFESKIPETFTVRLGPSYTELSLARGKNDKITEIARQIKDELTFEKYA